MIIDSVHFLTTTYPSISFNFSYQKHRKYDVLLFQLFIILINLFSVLFSAAFCPIENFHQVPLCTLLFFPYSPLVHFVIGGHFLTKICAIYFVAADFVFDHNSASICSMWTILFSLTYILSPLYLNAIHILFTT